MTTNLNDINTNFINDYCQQMTKQLLDLAQTFARKSRRPSTQLKCTDLINAFDCMNIKTIRDKEQLLINSFDHMLEIEYK
jgi:DNA-binding transcriptional regulator YiaG